MKLDRAIDVLLAETPLPPPSPEYAEAARALRDHLNTRAKPRFSWLAGKRPPATTERVEAKAETVCDHTFTFNDHTLQLGTEIDWTGDYGPDPEWANELHRHKYWSTLGEAYCRTGNPKYAREFAGQLQSWLAHNAVPTAWDGSSGPWRPFEAGIRCVTWLEALNLFLPAEDVDATELSSLVVSLAEHGDFLLTNRTARNHRVKEAFGLIALGVLLPELPNASEWLATGQERIMEVLEEQFLPDGAHFELSPMYQHVVCGQLLKLARFSKRAQVAWPESFLPAVVRMCTFLRDITKPDGTLPQFNDGDATDARSLLRRAAKVLDEPSLDPFAEAMPSGTTSWRSPWSGIAIMRSGWDPDAGYLAFDTGPLGASDHKHEDGLSFELSAGGHHLLRNSGRFTYVHGPVRRYFQATESHNTAVVDGHGQSRGAQPRPAWMHQLEQTEWFAKGEAVFASGTYDQAYGPVEDVAHTRSILYHAGHSWLLYDVFSSDACHEYTIYFHLADDDPDASVEIDGTRVVLSQPDGGGLQVLPLFEGAWRIDAVRGSDAPIAGWYSPAYNDRRPITRVSYSATSDGPTAFAAALVPFVAGDGRATVDRLEATLNGRAAEPWEAVAGVVSTAGGRRLAAIRGLSDESPIAAGSQELRGRALAAELDGADSVVARTDVPLPDGDSPS